MPYAKTSLRAEPAALRETMRELGMRQRGFIGKRVGKPGDRFFEQVNDRPAGSVTKWLRQCFEFVPGPIREPKDPITH